MMIDEQKRTVLSMWTIFDGPLDHRSGYIARRFEASAEGIRASDETLCADSLKGLREKMVRRGLTCIGREGGDSPETVETWL